MKYFKTNNSIKQILLVVYDDKQIKESILCVDVDLNYKERVDLNTNLGTSADADAKTDNQNDRRIESFTIALGFKRGYLKLLHYKYKDSKLTREIRPGVLR